ncbi:hypothetical protein F511_35014 [Dorcoceras hygrometricum]|uniref:Uncharacterized protein n=1 Tax=Dorcoceras hygrometricum TaxID=472368 RepID=A0A2Z7D7D7_9LAMI|nr:hypothetical protein F511_35014 [Dorcoceras hygrometricum]
MKRRRLKYCDWYQLRGDVATGVREMLRLVVLLREIVRYCILQLVVVTVASDWICLAWFEISAAGFFASAGRLGLQIRYQILYLEFFQPFVPYLSNPRALFSREFSGEFQAFPVVVLLVRGCDLLRSLWELRYGVELILRRDYGLDDCSCWCPGEI